MADRTTRYTPEQKAEALRLYRAGYSCRATAEETGVGFRAVATWARRAGIIRPRSQRSREERRRSEVAKAEARRRRHEEKEQARRAKLDEMKALRKQGLTYREIGRRYGHSRQTIARWLRQ